ncbi:MAG: hydroxymethylbilane synthase [Planctomycetia bacterium]|nr:hydroxymethylbilane synthase [Planctomycetia bacterium]
MSEKVIRIGTRASQLAQWQATWCANRLESCGIPVEVVLISTSGDKIAPDLRTLLPAANVTQGIFTKEIQNALLDGRVDLAVHSLKDLPTDSPTGLRFVASPERGCVEDVLVLRKDFGAGVQSLRDLPNGTIIGTSSLRRRAQTMALAKRFEKSWELRGIRGNLNTRLAKLDSGEYDALILARAGVERLGWNERISLLLPLEDILPAVGQGAIALETREDDAETIACLKRSLNCDKTFRCVQAERDMLRALQGGCSAPIGALCTYSDGLFTLWGRVAAVDGRVILDKTRRDADTSSLGKILAEELLRDGAQDLIREARDSAGEWSASV